MNRKHRQAQDLSSQAALLRAQGRYAEAAPLFVRAAALEKEALRGIPKSQPRTRGILSVSLAAMLYKAEEYDRAELELYAMLADEALPAFARRDLRELLEVVLDEKALKDSRNSRYTNHEIDVAMRGGVVGHGSVPLEDFIDTSGKIERLLWRVMESSGGFEFRKQGAPHAEVRQMIEARVAQPMAGSYRFRVRLVEPRQPDLFKGAARISPRVVSETLFGFIRGVDHVDRAELATLVPDEVYRDSIATLVKRLIPTGDRVHEVELRRPTETGPEETLVLTPSLREKVRQAVPPRPTAGPGGEEQSTVTLEGVLRALDLDREVLEIKTPDDRRVQLTSKHIVFDDWVAPLVNKTVIATGRWITAGTKFEFDEVELPKST